MLPVLVLLGVARAQVTGVVVDHASGEPVAGAIVTVQATTTRVSTGADGRFTLAVPGVVVAAAEGWFNASVTAIDGEDLAIRMDRVPTTVDPDWRPLPAETCMRCHPSQFRDWSDSPMAHAGDNTWVFDLFDGTGTASGDSGWTYTRDSVHAGANPASECRSCHQPEGWIAEPYSAMSAGSGGVSCEICHRIAEVDPTQTDTPGLWAGAVRMATDDSLGTVQFGLLGDVDYEAPEMRAAYAPDLGALVCAACHQDRNDPDGDGDFSDGVVSEPTWDEWLASPYADPASPDYATCADCHMGASDERYVCSTIDLERPAGQVRSHDIRGTTPAFLEQAVAVELDTSVEDGELVVHVAVTNVGAGHHVPTGVTVRNAILLVEATGADGPLEAIGDQVVDDLGGVGDPEQGYWAGLPGKVFAKRNHDADGAGPVFYTEATGLVSDTRIPALATDTSTYRFALPRRGGNVAIEARVVYRRAFRAVVDAKGWTADGHGAPLADLAAPDWGHVMADASADVAVPGACGCTSAGPAGGLPLIALLVGLRRRRGPPRAPP